jgi:hypothetical protein
MGTICSPSLYRIPDGLFNYDDRKGVHLTEFNGGGAPVIFNVFEV